MTTKDNNEAASAPDLRAVLIEVQKALKIANETPGGPIRDTIWMPHEASETLFDFIEAALEAASASQSITAGAAKGGITCIDRDEMLAMAAKAGFGVSGGFVMPPHAGHITAELEAFSLAHVARQRQESLTCPKCGADRLRGPCGNMEACGLTGTTYATPSAAVAEGVDTALPSGFLMPEDAWNEYATRSGLLNENGVAPQPATTQAAYFAYIAAWNRLHAAFSAYVTTYGAQQREAGRQEGRKARDVAVGGLSAVVEHWKERAEKAEAALARQPMTASRPAGAASEGLTEKPEWRDLRRALAILMCGLSDKPVATCERVLEQAASNESGVIGQARATLSAVPPAKAEGMTSAAQDVLAERQRQVSDEGWEPDHDDEHDAGELSLAAACYALAGDPPHGRSPNDWPWDEAWWKPADARRNLVKAGALILADIERIDRAIQAKKGNQQ